MGEGHQGLPGGRGPAPPLGAACPARPRSPAWDSGRARRRGLTWCSCCWPGCWRRGPRARRRPQRHAACGAACGRRPRLRGVAVRQAGWCGWRKCEGRGHRAQGRAVSPGGRLSPRRPAPAQRCDAGNQRVCRARGMTGGVAPAGSYLARRGGRRPGWRRRAGSAAWWLCAVALLGGEGGGRCLGRGAVRRLDGGFGGAVLERGWCAVFWLGR